jgi:hypothetical protein
LLIVNVFVMLVVVISSVSYNCDISLVEIHNRVLLFIAYCCSTFGAGGEHGQTQAWRKATSNPG